MRSSATTRLATSAAAHALALFLAASIHSSGTVQPVRIREHVVLVAPAIRVPQPHPARPVAPRTPPASVPPAHTPRRSFVAPEPTRRPAPSPLSLDLPGQPSPSLAPPPTALPTPGLPPAPVVVGKLASASYAGTAAPPAAARSTHSSTFGDASVSSAAAPEHTARSARTTAVEILSKPNPLYTAEARALRIEGEVLLEVLFTASGHTQVLRVLRGLGHGLDEAAAFSAANIQFRPATKDGVPIGQTATVHIVFQLAY